jgi:hypothetical protein
MRRTALIGAALAVAIGCAALSADAASAKTTLLITEEEGPVLPVGASVGMYIEFQEAECVLEGAAVITVNREAKDLLDGSGLPVTLCDDSETPGGAIREIQLTSSGKATIRSTEGDAMRLDPGLEGCVYEFTKLVGTYKPPEISTISGEAKGKLSKAYSTATGCEKKLLTEFTLYLEAGGELLTS